MRDRYRGGGFCHVDGVGLEIAEKGAVVGHTPRFSDDEAWQVVEQPGEDRLIGGARRQVDVDLLFQFDDAGGELQ